MMRTTTVILLAALAASGCQQTPLNHAWSSKNIQSLSEPKALRAVANQCGEITDAYVEAKERLNSLPPPRPSRLQLRNHALGAATEKVMYEADVFFDLLESYPPDVAFKKLEELLSKMNGTYEVISVEVTGYTDVNEVDLKSFDLARRRAQFVAAYFKAAGLQESTYVLAKTALPRHPDTPEGRARDRSASVAVIARRDRARTQ